MPFRLCFAQPTLYFRYIFVTGLDEKRDPPLETLQHLHAYGRRAERARRERTNTKWKTIQQLNINANIKKNGKGLLQIHNS